MGTFKRKSTFASAAPVVKELNKIKNISKVKSICRILLSTNLSNPDYYFQSLRSISNKTEIEPTINMDYFKKLIRACDAIEDSIQCYFEYKLKEIEFIGKIKDNLYILLNLGSDKQSLHSVTLLKSSDISDDERNDCFNRSYIIPLMFKVISIFHTDRMVSEIKKQHCDDEASNLFERILSFLENFACNEENSKVILSSKFLESLLKVSNVNLYKTFLVLIKVTKNITYLVTKSELLRVSEEFFKQHRVFS